jgi:hypothetical protein
MSQKAPAKEEDMQAELVRRREVLCDAIMHTFSSNVPAVSLERVLERLRSGTQDNLLLAIGLAMINFVDAVKHAMTETFGKIDTLAHMEPPRFKSPE